MLALAVVITFNVMNVYSLACPVVCTARRCNANAEAPMMPGMAHCKQCCPHSHSGDAPPIAPCTPASHCVSHLQQSLGVACPAPAVSTLHGHFMLALAPRASMLNLAPTPLVRGSHSPPGLQTGREVCRRESRLRV